MKCSAAASHTWSGTPGTGPANWVISSVSASAARSDGVMPTRDVSHWRRRGRLWTDCPAHANLHGITIACQPINLGLTVRLTFVPSTADLRESCLMGTSAPLASDVDVRGQRVVSLASYSSAVVSFCFATVSLFGGGPGPVVLINFMMAISLASIPSLRRFGPLVPAAAFVLVGTTSLCVLTVLLGTDAGLQSYFFVMAAAAPMVVGIKRIWTSVGVLVICASAVIILHFAVAADTGTAPQWLLDAGYVVNAITAGMLAAGIVGYGLLEIQRAEAALEEEYERSEALLDNILPRTVVERLKQPDRAEIADDYADASILFADIAGFTEMSSHTSAPEVVRFLDRLYTELDALVETHGLEKIKTTGDSYMVVSGVPDPRPDHLQALARFALDMSEVCADLHDADGHAMPLRIGIADGPVVAGVVGSKKFFFDVWGDAVNLASRMESTGVPGRIQVTSQVRDELADDFDFEERGTVTVKGKDDQHTWFLLDRRTEPAI